MTYRLIKIMVGLGVVVGLIVSLSAFAFRELLDLDISPGVLLSLVGALCGLIAPVIWRRLQVSQ